MSVFLTRFEPADADGLAETDPGLTAASRYRVQSTSIATRRAYAIYIRRFQDWCTERNQQPIPADPETVAQFIAYLADANYSLATIRTSLAAIRSAHAAHGVALDSKAGLVGSVLAGIRRIAPRASNPPKQARPLSVNDIRKIVTAKGRSSRLTTPLIQTRNRAMLLIGYAAALRRSELSRLELGDVNHIPGRGLRLHIRSSKTDQTGKGAYVGIAAAPEDPIICPVTALKAYLAHRLALPDVTAPAHRRTVASRPLFVVTETIRGRKLPGPEPIDPDSINRVVKVMARRAGYKAADFSAHSLRSGFITEAFERGVPIEYIQQHVRHACSHSTLGYVRPQSVWHNNPTIIVFQQQRARQVMVSSVSPA